MLPFFDLFDDPGKLGIVVWRNDDRHGPPFGLLHRVTQELLCPPVPAHNGAIQTLAYDAVIGRFNNGSHERLCFRMQLREPVNYPGSNEDDGCGKQDGDDVGFPRADFRPDNLLKPFNDRDDQRTQRSQKPGCRWCAISCFSHFEAPPPDVGIRILRDAKLNIHKLIHALASNLKGFVLSKQRYMPVRDPVSAPASAPD